MILIIEIEIYLKETDTYNKREVKINLNKKEFTIGSDDINELQLNKPNISGKQAKIELVNGQLMYTDLSQKGSTVISKSLGIKKLKNKSNLYIHSGDIIILPENEKSRIKLLIK